MDNRDKKRFDNREMHDAVCSDCGNETQVPFKPAEGRPVYCRDCFQKHRNENFGKRNDRFERNDSQDESQE